MVRQTLILEAGRPSEEVYDLLTKWNAQTRNYVLVAKNLYPLAQGVTHAREDIPDSRGP